MLNKRERVLQSDSLLLQLTVTQQAKHHFRDERLLTDVNVSRQANNKPVHFPDWDRRLKTIETDDGCWRILYGKPEDAAVGFKAQSVSIEIVNQKGWDKSFTHFLKKLGRGFATEDPRDRNCRIKLRTFYSLRNYILGRRVTCIRWEWELNQNILHIRGDARQFTMKTGHTRRDSLTHTPWKLCFLYTEMATASDYQRQYDVKEEVLGNI